MKHFLEVLDVIGAGAWARDIRSGQVVVTPGLWQQLGYQELDELNADAWQALIHPDDLDRYRDSIDSLLSGSANRQRHEFRLKNAKGGWGYFKATMKIVRRHDDGSPAVLGGLLEDITTQHIERLGAKADQARLVLARELSGVGTWEVDIPTGEVFLDTRSLEMHGLPADLPMPTSHEIWAATVDSDALEGLRALDHAVTTGSNYSFEYSTGSGRRWVWAIANALYDSAGRPIKLVGLNLDITKRRRAERSVVQMRSEMVELARMSAMGSMASAIAHELNQPLAAISNYLGVAELKLEQNEWGEAADAIRDALGSTLRAGGIIRRIRNGSHNRIFKRDTVDLAQAVEAATNLATLDAPQRGIDVRRDLHGGLVIQGDQIQIEQVIINLIRNAMDAVDDADIRKVKIRTRREGHFGIIEVSDTGCGISESMLPGLFETFITSKSDGMGLGLSICQTIVEAHEGTIDLVSTSPKGTKFSFRLPLADEAKV